MLDTEKPVPGFVVGRGFQTLFHFSISPYPEYQAIGLAKTETYKTGLEVLAYFANCCPKKLTAT